MKNLCFAVCFISIIAFGQKSFKFQGTLLNKENNQPIAFAHFQYENQGFVSDSDGMFDVMLNTTHKRVEVRISALGFQTLKTTLVHAERNKVYMKPEVFDLQEVVVNYEDPAVALVKKVIKNIPKNYPDQFEQLYGEYNENVFWDSLKRQPIYKVKVKTRADKFSYNRKSDYGNVEILAEDVQLFGIDSLRVRFYAGGHIMHSQDFVMKRKNFLNSNKIKRYNLIIQDTVNFNHRQVIKLKFHNKSVSGVAYIDLKTFALVHLERFIDYKKIKSPLEFLGAYKRKFVHEIINYKLSQNNKWRINFIHLRTAFKHLKSTRTIHLDGTYLLEKVEKGEKIIPKNKRLLYKDILLSQMDMDSFINHSKAQFKKEFFFRFISRLKSSIGFVFIPLKIEDHQLLNPSFELDQSIDLNTRNLIGNESRLDYLISNTFGIQFNTLTSLSKKEYNHSLLGVWKRGELSQTGQLNYQLSASLYTRKLRLNHGQNVFSGTIIYKGEKFDSGRFQYFSEQRDFGLSTTLNFDYRFTRAITLGIFTRYFYTLGGNTGLYIREKGEFWFWNRSSIYDKDGLSIKQNKIIENMFQFGVIFTFGL